MISSQIIDNAIAAHSSWKARLRTAITSGKFEMPSATVKSDNKCEFGKWLYGVEISAQEKQSENYLVAKRLHAQFHEEAAKIVDLINSGRKDAAEQAIGMGGSYAKVSSALTEAMIRWRQSLK